ncbi:MAG: aspartate/glutamate racemase family protein [Bacillota bacterium]
MKTIGLIGGMSWESSLEYYRLLNHVVKERLGEPHSAELIMYSVDFAEYERLQHAGDWEQLGRKMIGLAQALEGAGAELLLICTNTMHKLAPAVQANTGVPLLHIADAAAAAIKAQGLSRVALLGTNFTMTEPFYKDRLQDKHGLEILIPDQEQRQVIHKVIYTELISGIINDISRAKFKKIIDSLKARGAQGVVLGCTEIPLLIKAKDSSLPVFDTTTLHALQAVEQALA